MVVAEETAAVQVGRMTFTLRQTEATPESCQRWQERGRVLASWLMSEWERERAGQCYPVTGQNTAERN